MDTASILAVGNEALTRGDWAGAKSHFAQALTIEQSPEAYEGLGTAASWLDDGPATLEARERAYRLYRERGDLLSAGRLAISLANDYIEFRDEQAVANGWLARARRLLEGVSPSAEHVWLDLMQAHFLMRFESNATTARTYIAQAASLARSLKLLDLEMMALAGEGKALVMCGNISQGINCLDEANTAVLSGEMMDIMAIASTCCYLIDTCERVRDFERAAQWSVHMKELCTRWQLKSTFAICRSQYAAVLMWRGQWAQAEAELEWATNILEVTRPNLISESLVRLAELRHRQGRLEEAALALDQNKPMLAIDIAERFLRHLPPDSQTDRAAVLENLAQAYILTANYDRAKATVHELGSLAALIGTEPLAASYNYAEGLLALSIGNHETARQRFEDALVLFERNGAPFETGRARLALARACVALGRTETAQLEAQAAQRAFTTLGAALEARRAFTLLRDLNTKTGNTKDLIALSRREREVATLISQGLTNREIAEQLVLSERTVESHVSNILSKLGFTARSQIAVWASEKHLAPH